MKKISRGKLVTVFISIYLLSVSVWAGYCGTDTTLNHVSAGRAELYYSYSARAVGSGDYLGRTDGGVTTLNETSPGHYKNVTACRPPQPTAGYPNATELISDDILNNLRGHYGVAIAGGHLVDSDDNTITWTKPTSSEGDIDIPEGSNIKYAFLYYSGSIALEDGDFTPDDLNNIDDVKNNKITFEINDVLFGPFDTNRNKPDQESEIGSETQMLPGTRFKFGTLSKTTTSFWGNRLDITGLLEDKTRGFSVKVNPPEVLDYSANSKGQNGGNVAGDTEFNKCTSVANWSIVVIYENENIEAQQIILKDKIVRAWDYTFIHSGEWERPYVKFEHAPMTTGAKFYTYAASGLKANTKLPSDPHCTCGCGGLYNIADEKKLNDTYQQPNRNPQAKKTSNYWTHTLEDPAAVVGDPMNRDSNSEIQWTLVNDRFLSVNGNDWTLFESGNKFTEFPNLYEGEIVVADDTHPITNENSGMMRGDIYSGHPWNGRGKVTYHGVGNSTSIVEVALNDNAITEGETQTKIYFKGDQKDVFKPQARVTLRYLIMTIPIDETTEVDFPPVIDLVPPTQLTLAEGDFYNEPGFSAADEEDGNLTSEVTVKCSFESEDPLELGTYECRYSVTDSYEQTTEISRTLNVIEYTPPTITLTPMLPPTLNEGDFFTEPGYQAKDFRGEDLTKSVDTQCDFLRAEPLDMGEFQCDYSVADSYGTTVTLSRSILVEGKTLHPPSIYLIPIEEPGFSDGDYFVEPGYAASDMEDGDLTANVTARCSFPAMSRLTSGRHECTYSVTDSDELSVTVVREFEITKVEKANPCVTSSLIEHSMAGRAYISYYVYFATGSNSYLGNVFFSSTKTQSLEFAPPNNWKPVSNCSR